MNLLHQAPVSRFPLVGVAALACVLAGSAGAWESSAPPPAHALERSKTALLGDDFRRILASDERAALPARQDEFRSAHLRSILMVFPVRIGDAVDTECAVNLARSLSGASVCQACGVARPVAFVASRPGADEKALWELARDFRDCVRKTPIDADYALYAEYTPALEYGGFRVVHLVLCDARGEWVIVDRQDLQSEDFQGIRPATKSDADALVVRRLQFYLSGASLDPLRPDIAPDAGPRRPIAGTSPPSFTP